LALVTALTLADKIITLYKNSNGKIQKQQLEDLGETAKQLSAKLHASSDVSKMIYVLREAEEASGQALQIKEVCEYVCNSSVSVALPAEVNDAMWQFTLTSLRNLITGTERLEAGPFSLVDEIYRAKYQNFTTQASSLAHQAIQPGQWTETLAYLVQLHAQYEALVSTIYIDVEAKVQSLVGGAEAAQSA
jgi:hypothetical protein